MSQICDHFSSLLLSIENLGVETLGPPSLPDDMDDEQWLRLIRAFSGAQYFRVASEFATDISHALRLADEGHEIVLPALRNLHVLQPRFKDEPSWDSIESFVTQRKLSSPPIQIYVRQQLSEESESIPVAQWRQQVGVLALAPVLPDAKTLILRRLQHNFIQPSPSALCESPTRLGYEAP